MIFLMAVVQFKPSGLIIAKVVSDSVLAQLWYLHSLQLCGCRYIRNSGNIIRNTEPDQIDYNQIEICGFAYESRQLDEVSVYIPSEQEEETQKEMDSFNHCRDMRVRVDL